MQLPIRPDNFSPRLNIQSDPDDQTEFWTDLEAQTKRLSSLEKIPQIRSQTGVRSKNGVRSILSSHPLTDYWLYDHLFTQSNYKHAAPTIVYSVIL